MIVTGDLDASRFLSGGTDISELFKLNHTSTEGCFVMENNSNYKLTKCRLGSKLIFELVIKGNATGFSVDLVTSSDGSIYRFQEYCDTITDKGGLSAGSNGQGTVSFNQLLQNGVSESFASSGQALGDHIRINDYEGTWTLSNGSSITSPIYNGSGTNDLAYKKLVDITGTNKITLTWTPVQTDRPGSRSIVIEGTVFEAQ